MDKNKNKGGGGTGGRTIRSGGTQVIVAKKTKTQQKNEEKQKKKQTKEQKPVNHYPKGKGISIGESSDQDEGAAKWQCQICKILNSPDTNICVRCESERGMTREKLLQQQQQGQTS